MPQTIVSVTPCKEYQLDLVRQAVTACLAPLGGIQHFVRPGMTVLLKPNMLTSADPAQAVTTHPLVVQAVAELVINAGATVWIGDSSNNSVKDENVLWQKTGMSQVAEATGAKLVSFSGSVWKRLHDYDYILARPLSQADLIINLPKLKTHTMTLYTGAIKNLFGCIPGARKTAVHIHAPGVKDFSQKLVDVLELVHPSLSIMDGIIGMDGEGPGTSGTPHPYGCLAASPDPVALDTIMARAMGYRPGEVLHIAVAGSRKLGVSDPTEIELSGDQSVLAFGKLNLPHARWQFNIPSWLSAPITSQLKLRPQVDVSKCIGCGTCFTVCPAGVITEGKPPTFDLSKCIGCMCCGESCPEGAITPHRTWLGKMVGLG
jgi:uncharacterized protein (DUF362 family)/Pyruvate/2-oxoacid:ferredoxin oxidoreductase delta subunit